jgi:tetratricopeptide (TPR) repeat protein
MTISTRCIATAAALLAVTAGVPVHGAETTKAAPVQQRNGAAAASHPAPEIRVARPEADGASMARLRAARSALQAGDEAGAMRLYEEAARADNRNVGALLGLGAIAARRGDRDAARAHYQRVLRLEPRNATALGALLALFPVFDRADTEIRLKALIAREPSAFLYGSLAQLYAGRSMWPQAQDAYFEAYRLEPDNADHAYNLAVALEHIGQHEPALDHYRRALKLARASRPARFDLAAAEDRVARLAAALGSR